VRSVAGKPNATKLATTCANLESKPMATTRRKKPDDGLHRQDPKHVLAEFEALLSKVAPGATVEIVKVQDLVLELENHLERMELEHERGVGVLKMSINNLKGLVGAETPEIDKAHTKGLTISDSTVVSVEVPGTLVNFVEKAAIPRVLVRAFANKTSRTQGSGTRHTITVQGPDEINAFLNVLNEYKSKSGWYVYSVRVIKDIEDQLKRQTRTAPVKAKGKR